MLTEQESAELQAARDTCFIYDTFMARHEGCPAHLKALATIRRLERAWPTTTWVQPADSTR